MSTAEFKARHEEDRKQRRFVLGEATHFHTRLAELFIDADRESYIGSFLEHSTFVLDDVALRSLWRPTHSPVRLASSFKHHVTDLSIARTAPVSSMVFVS